MVTDMTGLFGPTPEEIQQQRIAGLRQDAASFAKMNPFEQATAGIYQGAGMLSDVAARALGGVNPQEQMAQQARAAVQGLDTSTYEGLMEGARRLMTVNPALAQRWVQEANKRKQEQIDADLKQSQLQENLATAKLRNKQATEEANPYGKFAPEPKDYTSESIRVFLETKNPADLVPRAKESTTSDSPEMKMIKDYAVMSGLTPGTPEYNKFVAAEYKKTRDKKTDTTVHVSNPPAPVVLTDEQGNVKLISRDGQVINEIKGAGKPTAEYAKRVAANRQTAIDLDTTIADLKELVLPNSLLDKSTGSGAGKAADATAAFFGVSTEGAQAAAKLAPIVDSVLKMVPRFQGPQSDKDVKIYKEAAGQLADTGIPTETRKAAAKTILLLMARRRGQFINQSQVGTPDDPLIQATPGTNPVATPSAPTGGLPSQSAIAAEIARRRGGK